jgi:Protein of unknown function (DUF3667)
MQGEAETAAEARTGAPAAAAAESTKPPPAAEQHASCSDCGAPLTGAYCAACGQRAHLHRSLTGLGHDILHGVFHFEGKFWRTLPELFFHPGRLTRRYIDGERTKFVSPTALFLFTVFAMFAVFAWTSDMTPPAPTVTSSAGERAAANAYPIEETRSKIRALRLQRDAPDTTQVRRTELEAEIDDLGRWLVLMEILAGLRQGDAVDASRPADAQAGGASDAVKVEMGWPALDRKLSSGLQRARENPRLFFYKLKSNAYKVSWALIPLSLPFLWLMFFWRRDFPLYDHAVFATYSISFMMLLLIVLSIAASLGVSSTIWETALVVIPPLHMYKQLRGAYGLSRAGAFVRLLWLMISTVVVLTLFGVLLIYFGVFS